MVSPEAASAEVRIPSKCDSPAAVAGGNVKARNPVRSQASLPVRVRRCRRAAISNSSLTFSLGFATHILLLICFHHMVNVLHVFFLINYFVDGHKFCIYSTYHLLDSRLQIE